ncbi:MAG: DNA-binding protein WhiA [Bacillota bacterium]
MSFSHDVKDELARVYPRKDCCKRAELGAIVRAAGTLGVGSGRRLHVVVSTEHPAVARKAFKLFKDLGVRPEFIVVKQSRLRKASRYIVRLGHGDAEALLDQMGFAKHGRLNYGIPPSMAARSCCTRAYLRGFFLGRGSVLSPATGNHLEMITKHEEQASDIQRLLKSLKIGASVIWRKADSVVYVKEGEQMARLLNLLGAHASLLRYEDVRVMKDVKNRVNRLVNMETANIEKIADAGIRQVRDITSIRASIGLERLPQSLRSVALARLNHPEVSLEELGALMDPPLTKSAVNHRLRRIHKIALGLEQDYSRDPGEHHQKDGVDLGLHEESQDDQHDD